MDKSEDKTWTSASDSANASATDPTSNPVAEVRSDLGIEFEPRSTTHTAPPAEPMSVDNKIRRAAEMVLSLASDSEWDDEDQKAEKARKRDLEEKIKKGAEQLLFYAYDSDWDDDEHKAWKTQQRKAEGSGEFTRGIKHITAVKLLLMRFIRIVQGIFGPEEARKWREAHAPWKCRMYGEGWYM